MISLTSRHGIRDLDLDAEETTEGVRQLWDLTEWDLARSRNLRPHLRFLYYFLRMTPDRAELPLPK